MYICIIYTHTFINAIKISNKIGHEFEGEHVGIYERVWREKRKGEMCLNYELKKRRVRTKRKEFHYWYWACSIFITKKTFEVYLSINYPLAASTSSLCHLTWHSYTKSSTLYG